MPRKNQIVLGKPVLTHLPDPAGGVKMQTFIPWRLIKRTVRKEIITPLDAPESFRMEAVMERQERKSAEDSPLVRALGLAYFWMGLLESGRFKTLREIAEAEGLDKGQVSRTFRLTRLAVGVKEVVASGVSIILS
ncbi:MAG: hypothetical protein WCP34_09790 [Pseudomonadota bacterium]